MADGEIKGQPHTAGRSLRFPLLLGPFVSQCLCGTQSIMQNKPNSFEDRNNATCFTTRVYANKPPRPARKKQTQSNPNKPNFKMGKMTIRTATTKAYANEQRTMSNERYSKQTQSNPIPPPPNPHFSPENESVIYTSLAPLCSYAPLSLVFRLFPPSARRKPGNYCEVFEVFFPVFALFFPRISSACSGVSGGHLPADWSSFRRSSSFMPTMVLHFGNLPQPRNGPLFPWRTTSSPSLHLWHLTPVGSAGGLGGRTLPALSSLSVVLQLG